MPELNLSLPGQPRYQPKRMIPIWGYDFLYKPVGGIEIATLESHAEISFIPAEDFRSLTPDVREKLLAITTTEVDGIEREVTQHDVRAWIYLAKEIVGK